MSEETSGARKEAHTRICSGKKEGKVTVTTKYKSINELGDSLKQPEAA